MLFLTIKILITKIICKLKKYIGENLIVFQDKGIIEELLKNFKHFF